MIVTILVFIVILSALVLIHELGHYIFAKLFGIKVEEFGFGFPPRVWGKKKGETIYSINLLPIGGFVKLYGEDDAGGGKISLQASKGSKQTKGKDLDRAFFTHPAWQRAIVIVAGVLMNFLTAVLIFYILLLCTNFKAVLPCIGDAGSFLGVNHEYLNPKYQCTVVIDTVSHNSPAEAIGVTSGSKILKVNGEQITNPDSFQQDISHNKGKTVALVWQDNQGKVFTKNVIPRLNPPKGQGSLGVSFPTEAVVLSYDTPTQKLFSGFTHPINVLIFQYVAMKHLIVTYIATGDFSSISNNVSGPVGLGSAVNKILSLGQIRDKFLDLLDFAGLISISLAFFNVLPIPALDGGRLFFILIELITGKKVPAKYESLIHSIGFVVLIGLVILITFNDIKNLFVK